MKKLRHLIVVSFLCLSTSQVLYAQTESPDRKEWLEQMRTEELKIETFVQEQMTNTAATEIIKAQCSPDKEHHELSEESRARLKDDYARNYYRNKYMALHPEALKVYNPGRVLPATQKEDLDYDKPAGLATNILCDDGDFETATPTTLGSSGFTGYASPTYNYYTGGLCSFIPATNVAYTNVGFSDPDNFSITDNIPDPNVPMINQTHNNSDHAIRINGYKRCDKFGINMLQKTFSSPTSGSARINFSYALVMQGPHDGSYTSGNAFFVARVLDDNGVEVGSRICVPANAAGTGFHATDLPDCRNTPNHKVKTLWRDWGCDFIEFDIKGGKTYTIEFFLSGCQWYIHYAYAYVDDICADVLCCPSPPPVPENIKCTTVDSGSKLTWDPVPGAAYYKVYITTFDRVCCKFVNPPYGYSIVSNTTNTTLTIPTSTVSCFSWSVQTVMPDSCHSPMSELKCSCSPPPPTPDSLLCTALPDASKLTWDPVPGAGYYIVYITTYDPLCCPVSNPPYGMSLVWNINATTVTVPRALAYCFSWKIQTVMPDSSRSLFSSSKCSCTPPPPPPTILDCDSLSDGSSILSWNPVAGAAYYNVILTTYDPICCPVSNPPYGMSILWNVTGTSVNVPNTFAPCFSWRVVTVMPDSSRSHFSVTKCSCVRGRGTLIKNGEGVKQTGTGETAGENIFVTTVPNPASDYIEFMVHNTNRQKSDDGLILYLYDANGREVIKKIIPDLNVLRLNIQPYPGGIYVYEIRNKSKVLYKNKIVIEP